MANWVAKPDQSDVNICDAAAPAVVSARGDGPAAAAAAGPGVVARSGGAATGDGAGAEAAAAPVARQASGTHAGPSPAPAAVTPGQREPGPGAQSPAPGPAGGAGAGGTGTRPNSPAGKGPGPPARGAVLADALDVVSDVRAMLECPICTELMLSPHVICPNGHASCLGCYEKLRAPGAGAAGAAQARAGRCPSCKEPLYAKPARNLALEAAAKRVIMPCPFADQGCPQTMLYEAAAVHACACPWRVVACGHFEGGRQCSARVCLEKMAAHWIETHGAARAIKLLEWPAPDKDGSACISMATICTSKNEDMSGDRKLDLFRAAAARGGEYTDDRMLIDIDLKRVGASVRFGLRQFGSGPEGYSLKEAVLTLGKLEGTHFVFVLPRVLAADECLADDALIAGRKPAVIMLAPQQLSYATVENENDNEINEGYLWQLHCRVELRFVRSAGGQA